jgi:hypothetical protein
MYPMGREGIAVQKQKIIQVSVSEKSPLRKAALFSHFL